MPGTAVKTEYEDLLARTEALVREFEPSLSAGTVITTVQRCRNELVRTGVRRGLAIAAEAMARSRLRATTELDQYVSPTTLQLTTGKNLADRRQAGPAHVDRELR
jgi:hypothetical protein